jgi:hypothetical protein
VPSDNNTTPTARVAFPDMRTRMVRSGYIGIQIGFTEYVMPVSQANELIGMINRTQHEGVERQTDDE